MKISKRICLEKKWSNNCVKHNISLPRKNGRILSLSPSAYYYHTGINASGEDIKKYKFLSQYAHEDERKEIEDEVLKLTKLNLNMYFFELKDELIELTYEEFNKYIGYSIKKDKFNRVQRLLKKWEQISHKYHYKVTGALRRINEKCDI